MLDSGDKVEEGAANKPPARHPLISANESRLSFLTHHGISERRRMELSKTDYRLIHAKPGGLVTIVASPKVSLKTHNVHENNHKLMKGGGWFGRLKNYLFKSSQRSMDQPLNEEIFPEVPKVTLFSKEEIGEVESALTASQIRQPPAYLPPPKILPASKSYRRRDSLKP